MPKLIDRTGQRIGRLTVLSRTVPDAHGHPQWLCRCDCGNEKVFRSYNLKEGNTVSCGCLRDENRHTAMRTHGHGGAGRATEYKIWLGVRDRCNNPKNKAYKFYGERGTRVDPAFDDFTVFLAEVGPRPSLAHSLDRIDTRGHYAPGNVRWATRDVQANNKTSNRRIEYMGKTLTLTQWAKLAGMDYSTLRVRIDKYGWPLDVALWKPLGDQRRGKREAGAA